MLFVGQKSRQGTRTRISEIAKGIDSPEYFIAKILQVLSRKRLIQSQKGPAGGFYLSKEGLECTLADIVRAIDGDKIFSGCGLGLKSCSEKEPCPIHDKFRVIREDIRYMLETVKLSECSERLEKRLTFLKRV